MKRRGRLGIVLGMDHGDSGRGLQAGSLPGLLAGVACGWAEGVCLKEPRGEGEVCRLLPTWFSVKNLFSIK